MLRRIRDSPTCERVVPDDDHKCAAVHSVQDAIDGDRSVINTTPR